MAGERLDDPQIMGALAVRNIMRYRDARIQAMAGSADFTQDAIVTKRHMVDFVRERKTLRAE